MSPKNEASVARLAVVRGEDEDCSVVSAPIPPRPIPVFNPESEDDITDSVLCQHLTGPNRVPINAVHLFSKEWLPADDSYAQFCLKARQHEADILVRRQPNGAYMILFRKAWLNMKLMTSLLREDERQLHSRRSHEPFDRMVWRMEAGRGLILNGWFSRERDPRQRPIIGSRIPPDWILNKIKYVVDQNRFAPDREHECRRGNCTSTKDDECSLYKYCLPQCTQIMRNRVESRLRQRDDE